MLCDYCGKPRTYYDHTTCTPDAEAQAERDTADDPGPDTPEFL
jgi:hypothetical protein